MSTVIGDITMSLDGFVHGDGPVVERLHTWALASDDPVDRGILEEGAAAGAVVMGRTTFDTVDGPGGWAPGLGYGAGQDTRPPFFVVTRHPPERVRLSGTHDFTFVTDGPAAALEAAKRAAGDGDVYVMGGGALVGSCLAAGLLDTLSVHVSPEVVGAGTPLFQAGGTHRLRQRAVRVSATAVHAVYDVAR